MASEKKNEFLDASDSEDDQANGYDSDNEIIKGGRSAKRRKVDSDDDEDDDNAASDIEQDSRLDSKFNEDKEVSALEEPSDKHKGNTLDKTKKKKPDADLPAIQRTLTKKSLVASEAAIKKSGVVYLSRIPPFLKPGKMRSLLEPYGKINRIFLAPEDPAARTRRIRGGGNKKRTFTEGWVEFVRKKDAKAVCELLNARTIGGKKGSYYHDDIWNLVYLKGFKWHNLTQQIAAEDAERSSRMRAEISKSTKENKEFVRNVERAKMLDGMQAKSKKRKAADDGAGDGAAAAETGQDMPARKFKQKATVNTSRENDQQPERVTRVLSKIF